MAPLHEAAASGIVSEVEKQLSARGVVVNLQDGRGWTALHWASKEGHLDVIKFLLSKGAELDIKNTFGDTPLHKARQWGQAIAGDYLEEQGAKLDRGIDGIRIFKESFTKDL
eukprot:UC1_evm4s153